MKQLALPEGGWLAVLTAATTAIAWGIADSLVAQIATARVLYSMGRNRHFPLHFLVCIPASKRPMSARYWLPWCPS